MDPVRRLEPGLYLLRMQKTSPSAVLQREPALRFPGVRGVRWSRHRIPIQFSFYRAIPPLLLALYTSVLWCSSTTHHGSPLEIKTVVFPANRILHFSGAGTLLLLAYAWGVVQCRWFLANHHFRLQRHPLIIGDHGANIRAGRQTLHYNPFRYDTRDYMGRALSFEEGRFEESQAAH